MQITIRPELETRLRDQARSAQLTVEAYLETLILEEASWLEPLTVNDPEFAEIQAAVQEDQEQAERGETRPASEVFAELRVKHGLRR